jgi:hypothetical protein
MVPFRLVFVISYSILYIAILCSNTTLLFSESQKKAHLFWGGLAQMSITNWAKEKGVAEE